MIAADPAVLPLGSIVHIEGMGRRQVQDTGSAIRGRHLDIFFDDCAEARRWGRQQRAVRILHPHHQPAPVAREARACRSTSPRRHSSGAVARAAHHGREGGIPILGNVLLEAKDGRLSIAATDLELSIRCGCEAQVNEPGAITVSGSCSRSCAPCPTRTCS